MYSRQQQCAGDDECDAASIAVVDIAKERCEQDSAEGGYAGEEPCDVGIDAIFHDQEPGGELQEWRDGGVEEYAEQRNEPEARRAQGLSDVAPAEFIVGGLIGLIGLMSPINPINPIQPPVHNAEDKERQEADNEQRQC